MWLNNIDRDMIHLILESIIVALFAESKYKLEHCTDIIYI